LGRRQDQREVRTHLGSGQRGLNAERPYNRLRRERFQILRPWPQGVPQTPARPLEADG
jgi:hypothetical protein